MCPINVVQNYMQGSKIKHIDMDSVKALQSGIASEANEAKEIAENLWPARVGGV